MSNINIPNAPVLIVGAGPVGLYIGYSLSQHGIRSIIIEKNSSLNNHPKSRSMNTRTMEILRTVEKFNDLISFALPESSRKFTWKYSLPGEEFYSISVKDPNVNEISPVKSSFLAQHYIERHIYKLISENSLCTIYFDHELQGIELVDDFMITTMIDCNTNKSVKFISKFLIGADGTHSKVRQLCNISNDNLDLLQSKCCNIYANIDLSSVIDDLSAGYFFSNPNIMGRSILAVNGTNEWLFGIHYNDDRTKSSFDDKFCIDEIKLMVGRNDLPINIINKNFWSSKANIAKQFKLNNIFLVGDSAHSMPPTGGLGLNTGLQDAHNLVWKLAFVINHGASVDILNSYHDERYVVAQANTEFSVNNAKRLGEINRNIFQGKLDLAKELLSRHHQHLNHLGFDLGMCYRSHLSVDPVNRFQPNSNIEEYYPSITPGCRAPHVEIIINNKLLSILDLFQHKFTLLQERQCPLRDVLLRFGLDDILQIYQLGVDFLCNDKKWEKLYSMSYNGFVLVRPDGHVAIHQPVADSKSEVLLVNYLANFKKIYE